MFMGHGIPALQRSIDSMRALVEIYEREGDFAGLAHALREQIELTTSKQEQETVIKGDESFLRRH